MTPSSSHNALRVLSWSMSTPFSMGTTSDFSLDIYLFVHEEVALILFPVLAEQMGLAYVREYKLLEMWLKFVIHLYDVQAIIRG